MLTPVVETLGSVPRTASGDLKLLVRPVPGDPMPFGLWAYKLMEAHAHAYIVRNNFLKMVMAVMLGGKYPTD